METVDMRTCKNGKHSYPVDTIRCPYCRKERQKEYYLTHKEERILYQKNRYLKIKDTEEFKEKQREYQLEKSEDNREKGRKYRAEHLDEIKAKGKAARDAKRERLHSSQEYKDKVEAKRKAQEDTKIRRSVRHLTLEYKARVKAYREREKDKIKERTAHRYAQIKDSPKYKDKSREYRDTHKKESAEYFKKRYEIQKKDTSFLARAAQHRKTDEEKKRKRAYDKIYVKERIQNDPFYALTRKIRRLIWISIKKRNYSKKSKAFSMLGCDILTLQWHIVESAIRIYGIYDSKQKYHIDHILPCASAKTEEELIGLQHYTNLQYLKPEDNQAKHAKLDWCLP